jgi:two-component system, LytTR family, sensor histidine kinase AlgZ
MIRGKSHFFGPRYLLRVATINLAAAAVSTVLFKWFLPNAAPLAPIAAAALVYSFSIGTLAGLGLPVVALRTLHLRLFSRVLAMAAATCVAAVAGCLLAGAIQIAIGLVSAADFRASFSFIVKFCVLIALVFAMAMFFYEDLRRRLETTTLELRTRELAEERARKLAAEARLSSLASQIHPHFLFNTLNSISALIPEDPRRAEEMVGRLAALLRFSLDAQQGELTALGVELKIVRDYLEIQKARFGDRLSYSIDVPAELEGAEAPPLAVASLVDNAVKHAVAPRREGGTVRVAARAQNGSLEIEVADDGPGFLLECAAPGHGIDNLLSRLAALYGPAAALEVLDARPGALVRMRLPQAKPV